MWRRQQSDADFAAEVESHIALEVERLIADGVSPDDARYQALRNFGSVTTARERHYESRRLLWLDHLWQDIRYAARSLRRTPTFTAAVVLTLALGIGGNTAIFTVVHSILLKPLPYADADRLVRVVMDLQADESPDATPQRVNVPLSAAEVAEVQARTDVLAAAGTSGPALLGLSGYEDGARLQGSRVTASLFPMLGARPFVGRVFDADDERPDAEAVIVLAYSTWRRFYGEDPTVIGRSVTFDQVLGPKVQTRYTVIGVMPDGFEFPRPQTQFWLPLPPPSPNNPPMRGTIVARLAEGVSPVAAAAALTPILQEFRQRRGATPATHYSVVSERDALVQSVRPALLILAAAVGFVLLIGCANVASLVLARARSRQREIAIRAALGAGQGRVMRHLLTESLLLAVMGGVVGLGVAFGGIRLLQALTVTASRIDVAAGGFPRVHEVALDGVAFLFMGGVSVLTGMAFGLLPAWRLSRTHAGDAMRNGGGSTRASRTVQWVAPRSILVTAQVAMALVLLIGGGLLLRSFLNLTSVDRGYDPSRVLTFQVGLPLTVYSTDRVKAFSEALVATLRVTPGVEAAAYANQLPMVQLVDRFPLRATPAVPPRQPPPPGSPDVRLVSRDYLQTMGIPVIHGRSFEERDGAGQPRVLLINDVLARREFGGQNPVGRTIYLGPDERPWQIAGVVENVRQFSLFDQPEPQVFIDMRQWPREILFPIGAYYAVRAQDDPAALVGAVRRIVQEVEPQAALFNVVPMQQLVATTIADRRVYAVFLVLFAAVAVVLAAIGVFGLVSYTVNERTREIGVRLALGASRLQVLGLVLRQNLGLAAVGIALGLGGAVLVTRYLETMLFGITPMDASTFAAMATVFVGVTILASYVPAQRATKVNPLVALRND